jgi:hypothetical protein
MTQIEAPDLDAPKIVNLPEVSFAMISHPQEFSCSNCGATIVHGISAMGAIGIVGIPLSSPERKAIILPPSGMKIVRPS